MTMLTRLFFLAAALAIGLAGQGSQALAQGDARDASMQSARVRIVTNSFVLPGKLHKLSRIAAQGGVSLDHQYVDQQAGGSNRSSSG